MNTPVPPPQALRAALRAAEEALADLTRARQAAPEVEPREALERLDRALETVEQAACDVSPGHVAPGHASPGHGAAGVQPAGSPTLLARLASVRARAALQERAVPDAAFDGLYEAIRSGAAADRWGRAGMSGAFLDAPRTLARWRFVASAACLLLLVGGAVLFQGRLAWDGGDRSRALHDPRDDLLRRIDETPRASTEARGGPGRVSPERARLVSSEGARRGSPEGTTLLRPVGHATSSEQPTFDRRPPRSHGYISFHFGWGGPAAAQSRRADAQALDAAGRRLRLLFPHLGRDAGTGPESN